MQNLRVRNSNENAANIYMPELKAVHLLSDTSDAQFLHELRNPLANIDMCLSLLKEPIDTIESRKYLSIISHSTLIIKTIISNKSIVIDKAIKKYSLNKVLDEAIELANDRIILRRIHVKKHYSEDGNLLFIDGEGIKTVFLNIIINATEAIFSNKGKLTITTESDNDKYVVIIEDNGIGISKENLQKLFNPYYTNKLNGLGLGLATTLAILKINHATIKVESIENVGTRFIMFFNK